MSVRPTSVAIQTKFSSHIQFVPLIAILQRIRNAHGISHGRKKQGGTNFLFFSFISTFD